MNFILYSVMFLNRPACSCVSAAEFMNIQFCISSVDLFYQENDVSAMYEHEDE
jgi:hypothetical protein